MKKEREREGERKGRNKVTWLRYSSKSAPSQEQYHQFSSVQLLSSVWLFATPWIAACQASLSITNSRRSLRFSSIESVMPSNHLIFCHFLLPSILSFPAPGSFQRNLWKVHLSVTYLFAISIPFIGFSRQEYCSTLATTHRCGCDWW